jgi:hypothetical protein
MQLVLKAPVLVVGAVNTKKNSYGAKGLCVGGGRAPLGYYSTRLLGRTLRHFLFPAYLTISPTEVLS